MGQGEIKQKIDSASEYLTSNPAEARYIDSVAVARLSDPGALAVDVTGPGGAHLATDMPSSVGGGDVAPSPGWYLRAAAASCVATLIGMRAAHQGVALAEVEVTVDSESDDFGILGLSDDVPAGPLSTRIHVRIRGTAAAGALREICEWAVDHCPVTDAVRRAIPVSLEVAAEAETDPVRLG